MSGGSRSGIEIDDSCMTAFNNLKMGKNTRYASFKMSSDLKKVLLEKEVPKSSGGSSESQYKEFVSQVPANDARYFIYDFEFTNADGDVRNKVALILWCPDGTSTKTKMLYTTTKDDFKRKLQGLQVEVGATDYDEIAYDSVLSRCQK